MRATNIRRNIYCCQIKIEVFLFLFLGSLDGLLDKKNELMSETACILSGEFLLLLYAYRIDWWKYCIITGSTNFVFFLLVFHFSRSADRSCANWPLSFIVQHTMNAFVKAQSDRNGQLRNEPR